jgi:hypothetical protein
MLGASLNTLGVIRRVIGAGASLFSRLLTETGDSITTENGNNLIL